MDAVIDNLTDLEALHNQLSKSNDEISRLNTLIEGYKLQLADNALNNDINWCETVLGRTDEVNGLLSEIEATEFIINNISSSSDPDSNILSISAMDNTLEMLTSNMIQKSKMSADKGSEGRDNDQSHISEHGETCNVVGKDCINDDVIPIVNKDDKDHEEEEEKESSLVAKTENNNIDALNQEKELLLKEIDEIEINADSLVKEANAVLERNNSILGTSEVGEMDIDDANNNVALSGSDTKTIIKPTITPAMVMKHNRQEHMKQKTRDLPAFIKHRSNWLESVSYLLKREVPVMDFSLSSTDESAASMIFGKGESSDVGGALLKANTEAEDAQTRLIALILQAADPPTKTLSRETAIHNIEDESKEATTNSGEEVSDDKEYSSEKQVQDISIPVPESSPPAAMVTALRDLILSKNVLVEIGKELMNNLTKITMKKADKFFDHENVDVGISSDDDNESDNFMNNNNEGSNNDNNDNIDDNEYKIQFDQIIQKTELLQKELETGFEVSSEFVEFMESKMGNTFSTPMANKRKRPPLMHNLKASPMSFRLKGSDSLLTLTTTPDGGKTKATKTFMKRSQTAQRLSLQPISSTPLGTSSKSLRNKSNSNKNKNKRTISSCRHSLATLNEIDEIDEKWDEFSTTPTYNPSPSQSSNFEGNIPYPKSISNTIDNMVEMLKHLEKIEKKTNKMREDKINLEREKENNKNKQHQQQLAGQSKRQQLPIRLFGKSGPEAVSSVIETSMKCNLMEYSDLCGTVSSLHIEPESPSSLGKPLPSLAFLVPPPNLDDLMKQIMNLKNDNKQLNTEMNRVKRDKSLTKRKLLHVNHQSNILEARLHKEGDSWETFQESIKGLTRKLSHQVLRPHPPSHLPPQITSQKEKELEVESKRDIPISISDSNNGHQNQKKKRRASISSNTKTLPVALPSKKSGGAEVVSSTNTSTARNNAVNNGSVSVTSAEAFRLKGLVRSLRKKMKSLSNEKTKLENSLNEEFLEVKRKAHVDMLVQEMRSEKIALEDKLVKAQETIRSLRSKDAASKLRSSSTCLNLNNNTPISAKKTLKATPTMIGAKKGLKGGLSKNRNSIFARTFLTKTDLQPNPSSFASPTSQFLHSTSSVAVMNTNSTKKPSNLSRAKTRFNIKENVNVSAIATTDNNNDEIKLHPMMMMVVEDNSDDNTKKQKDTLKLKKQNKDKEHDNNEQQPEDIEDEIESDLFDSDDNDDEDDEEEAVQVQIENIDDDDDDEDDDDDDDKCVNVVSMDMIDDWLETPTQPSTKIPRLNSVANIIKPPPGADEDETNSVYSDLFDSDNEF
eukprot:TRINITY_DN2150_c0_g5_i1.p1 TRINITY_DN2150_c0_g5~~TRINITY_DN2150_c0_g5_i1.p1  ORF type:complete len:1465 (+),score=551.74 TRINITY_DN2150_c0_g5_i1:491-4396(+)